MKNPRLRFKRSAKRADQIELQRRLSALLEDMGLEVAACDWVAEHGHHADEQVIPAGLTTQIQAWLQHEHSDQVRNPSLLIRFVAALRPPSSQQHDEINRRFDALIDVFDTQPQLAQNLIDYLLTLLVRYRQITLYADSGISDREGFFSALWQRLFWRILPPMRTDDHLRDLFELVFHRSSDWRWIEHIEPTVWQRFFAYLSYTTPRADLLAHAQHEIINALMLVSYRITAIGMEPELLRAYPDIENFESPFLVQNREVIDFVEIFRERKRLQDNDEPISEDLIPDSRPAEVMLSQCDDILGKVRRATRTHGVSISLTNLLLRLEQSLARITVLFGLLEQDAEKRQTAFAELLRSIAYAQHEQSSAKALVSMNTQLLLLQVTENASRTGEHYVTDDRPGYFGMWKSAMGGGFIIAFLATIKVLMGKLPLAPLIQGLAYGFNYSFGFMLIHILHFTVATKQPAMTAAAMASTVQQYQGRGTRNQQIQLNETAQLIVNIFRTQLVAILGNISIAMPIGLLIAWGWGYIFPHPLMDEAKAMYTLNGINPFTSLSLMYAAIAGVCLFLSGLIAGYYDNLAVYNQIGDRLRQHTGLQRRLGRRRLQKVSGYIEHNLGALAGNFWFGMMLGLIPTLGAITGLPLDIRHIAFSSANLTQALFSLPHFSWQLAAISFLGVLMIGLVNLMVSFSLALLLALRARQVSFTQWLPLARTVFGRLLSRPADFFLPPPPGDTKQDTITF